MNGYKQSPNSNKKNRPKYSFRTNFVTSVGDVFPLFS